MRAMSLLRIVLLTALICVWHSGAAQAQANPTPRQLQALIANGQESTALADLQNVLQAHPDSGVAWYLTAEAQDAAGNGAAARTALANAERYAPGLPFAQPDKVAALRAHLAAAPAARHGFGLSPTMIVIGALILLFIVLRGFLRPRRYMPPQNGFGPGYPGQPPGPPPGNPFGSGPGGMPYGQNPYGQNMGGSGLGSSIVTGLAAGAGFAAGERIVDGLMDGSRGDRPFDPSQGIGQMPAPDRDDGLTGSPNWNDNSGNDDDDQLNNGGGFDPGNDW
jgi:uncharacterized protein